MSPDFKPALKHGVKALMDSIDAKLAQGGLNDKQIGNLQAMKRSLACAIKLAHRYADLAQSQLETADPQRKAELELMIKTLHKVPELGAETLQEAMQKHPERVVEHAVKGMLPHTKLGAKAATRLHVYAGEAHKHEAQKPIEL